MEPQYTKKLSREELCNLSDTEVNDLVKRLRAKETGRLTHDEHTRLAVIQKKLLDAAFAGGKVETDTITFAKYAVIDGIRYDIN